MAAVFSVLKDNRVKALAVAGLKRLPPLPDLPTFAETINPGFEIGSWYGVMAPAKTPPAIVKRLSSEIAKAVRETDMKSRLAQQGVDAIGNTPQEAGAYLRSEVERWSKVVKTAGVKLE